MRSEYYRVVIENGRVRINVFDKGNKDPIYSTDVRLTDKQGREIVALFLQKYGIGIKEYQEICECNEKEILNDLRQCVGDKNGKI